VENQPFLNSSGSISTLPMKNKLYLLLISVLFFASCSQEYTISGNSEESMYDGKMLYLRGASSLNNFAAIDSCQIQHGAFHFYGDTDSVMLVGLYMGGDRLMPVVLEQGNLSIEVSHLKTKLSGSVLNDKLNKLLVKRSKILAKQDKLRRKCIEMLYKGCTNEDIEREITEPSQKLVKQLEDLETDFIKENYQNTLGPGLFMWLFGQYPVPVLTPQIQKILDSAPQEFKGHPFILEYVRQAGSIIGGGGKK
jgi:hypothetical protein